MPVEFAGWKDRTLHSTLYGFSNNIALCSYLAKVKKPVVLLSTSHYSITNNGPDNKPEMIMDYNSTKGGVDNMDKMVSEYSTKRSTKRWPLAFFYNILEIAALAAYVIHKENNPSNKDSGCRRKFLQGLAKNLVRPEVEKRFSNPQIMRHLSSKLAIQTALGKEMQAREGNNNIPVPRDASGRLTKKGNCSICKTQQIPKQTRKVCDICGNPVCAIHSCNYSACTNCCDSF